MEQEPNSAEPRRPLPGPHAMLEPNVAASPGRRFRPLEGEVVYKPWSSSVGAPPPPLDRPVWVHLDRLYGPPENPGPGVDPPPGGYPVATGRVPGLLKRWTRAVDGRWFGRVDFAVCDSYGAVVAEHLAVLVPGVALSPREGEPRR